MELRHLRSLVAVADERHFTRAAASIPIAQSALSQHVRKLEQELGVPLVDRTTRRVALTPAGERLATAARRAMHELDGARQELEAGRELVHGRLAIGVTAAAGAFDLAGLLAEVQAARPGVELLVREGLSADLAAALRRDELDLAFVTRLQSEDVAGLDLERVSVEPLVAVVPTGHRLAGRRRVRLRDLDGERFIALPRSATVRRAVDGAARAEGLSLRVAFEVGDAARVRELVRVGLGVAVLPAGDVPAGDPHLRAVSLTGGALVHEVLLARRRGRRPGPAVGLLLSVLDGR